MLRASTVPSLLLVFLVACGSGASETGPDAGTGGSDAGPVTDAGPTVDLTEAVFEKDRLLDISQYRTNDLAHKLV